MKYIGISGSWGNTSLEMEKAIRDDVKATIERGDGIVSGGALGTDFIALDEALKCNPDATQIKIIIPTPLEVYTNHYFNRAREGVISMDQARRLAEQLKTLRDANPDSLIEMSHAVCNQETYFDRNTKVVEASDELLAYRVNMSEGTTDTIEKAKRAGMPVHVRDYDIPQISGQRR